jgi:transaldolase
MKKLRLEVLFGGEINLVLLLKSSLVAVMLPAKLKKTKDELKALNDQQKKIDGYTKQKKAVQDNAKALQDLQSHIKSLRQQMSTNPSDALTKEFDKAVAKARKLKQEYEKIVLSCNVCVLK